MQKKDLRSLWEQRLAEFENSGISISAWCQENGIKVNRFYYWRKKLISKPMEKEQPIKWFSLALDSEKPGRINPDSIAVHIGRATIEITKGFDQHLLREIVQVLQTI